MLQLPGDRTVVRETAACLEAGGVAILPAEGLYGLHARLSAPGALDRIRRIKADPAPRPYILLLAAPEDVGKMAARWPRDLIASAWPGPLTLILPATPAVPEDLTREGCVAVRCPGSRLLREVAGRISGPLLSTSANRSGAAPPARVGAIERAVSEQVDLIVDGGALSGEGSTVARVEPAGRLTVLRQGAWRADLKNEET